MKEKYKELIKEYMVYNGLNNLYSVHYIEHAEIFQICYVVKSFVASNGINILDESIIKKISPKELDIFKIKKEIEENLKVNPEVKKKVVKL